MTEQTDSAYFTIDDQLYNELQLSDSDQSEIDFELPTKALVTEDSANSFEEKKSFVRENRVKYISIKSENIVRKIRLDWKNFRGSYLDKVKRQENYKRILRMIRQAIEKKEKGKLVLDQFIFLNLEISSK